MASKEDAIAIAPVEEKHTDASSAEDVEKQVVAQMPELKRKLKSRHLQMIAIGMYEPYGCKAIADNP
jgi:amino acid permease